VNTLPDNKTLAFSASGTNEFAFDTGVLKGKLRAEGNSRGLSSVVHLPTGATLDSSMGLFGHYRVFTANKRYGTAAWDWPSVAKLRRDGSVEVRWPSAEDRPFELRAVYRWAAPNILDLETSVQAKTNLAKFESFLASYFAEGFTNSCVYAQSTAQPGLETADKSYGIWQAFPRDDQAVSIIQDGRWKILPNPVDWTIRPHLAKPLGVRRCPANGVSVLLMAPPPGLLRGSNSLRGRAASLDVSLALRQRLKSRRDRPGAGEANDCVQTAGHRNHGRIRKLFEGGLQQVNRFPNPGGRASPRALISGEVLARGDARPPRQTVLGRSLACVFAYLFTCPSRLCLLAPLR